MHQKKNTTLRERTRNIGGTKPILITVAGMKSFQLFTMVSDAGSDFAVTATLGLVLAALCALVMGLGEWAGRATDPKGARQPDK